MFVCEQQKSTSFLIEIINLKQLGGVFYIYLCEIVCKH